MTHDNADYVKPIASPVPGYEWQTVYDDSDPPVYLGTFLVPIKEAHRAA